MLSCWTIELAKAPRNGTIADRAIVNTEPVTNTFRPRSSPERLELTREVALDSGFSLNFASRIGNV
jgi:hypothetical protein